MQREAAELVGALVAIDSVNPGLQAGGPGEAAMAAEVARWLERAGLEVDISEVEPGRPNVVGVARGLHDGPRLLLTGHTDTVGTGGMADPHALRVDGDRLVGRGAYDMKGGLAAAMLAAARAPRLGGDLVVAAVCDEELASLGTEALVHRVQADAAIVPEPTDLAVAVAHKGFVGFTVTTEGVAAHGSMPHLGRDAILAMAPVLAALRELDGRLQASAPHPLLGVPSLHASLIEGGQEFSSYPAACVLTGEVRTVPGMADPLELLSEAVGSAGRVHTDFAREPMSTPADSRIAQLVLQHAEAKPAGMPYWTDGALLAAAGIPTVVFGPTGGGAHGDDEWVDLTSVERVADVLLRVARDFCS